MVRAIAGLTAPKTVAFVDTTTLPAAALIQGTNDAVTAAVAGAGNLATHRMALAPAVSGCQLATESVLGPTAPDISSSELLSADDGCATAVAVSSAPEVAPPDLAVAAPEAGVDPGAQVDVGQFDAQTVGWAPPDELSAISVGAALADPVPALVPRAAYKQSAGKYWAYYEDPPGKMVVLDRIELDFRYGGGCVHNPADASVYRWWLTETGWGRYENDYLENKSCGSIYGSDSVHFRNGSFCAGRDTHLYFNRTVGMGYPDGTLKGSDAGRKEGGCVNLLRHQTKLTRSKPYYSCKGDDC